MMLEGTIEVTGTLRAEQSGIIANYRTLLDNAFESGNNEQAELYCNKIIEIDPSNWYAWLRKGHAAGWQSSLSNLRISEAITCYGSSLNCADEEAKEMIVNYSKQDMQDMCLACVNLQLERFSKWPDDEETNGTLKIVLIVLKNMTSYISTMMVSIDVEEFVQSIAANITSTVINTWNDYITREYVNDDDTGHPGKYAFTKLLERADCCRTLLLKAIELSKSSDENDIDRYKSLIAINNYCINSAAWDYNYVTDYILGIPYNTKNWYKVSSLTQEGVNRCQRNNSQYQSKIEEIRKKKTDQKAAEEREKQRIEQEKKDARIAAYWNAHPAEKKKFDSEKEELLKLVSEFNRLLAAIPEDTEIKDLQERIDYLQKRKNSLSALKLKQRKEVQKQIDEATTEMDGLKSAKESAIQARKTVALQRIVDIDRELKRDRS